MMWSKLKKRVEENLAKSIYKKVEFFTTAYRKPNSTTGRGWITIEGQEIVNFSTMDSGVVYGRVYNETTPNNKKRFATHEKINSDERDESKLIEKGEFSRFDLHICMFESLSMTNTQMLEHESPIIQTLGILDKRTGKRTLNKFEERDLDALPKYFLNYRLTLE